MQILPQLAFGLSALAYVVAALLFFVDLAARQTAPGWARYATPALVVGAICHLANIVIGSLVTMVCPVSSLGFSLSLAALVTVGVYLVLGRTRRLQALGAFAAPFALTFLVASQFLGAEQSESPNRALLAVHVLSNLVGLGLFLLAAGVGLFYIVHERRLKARKLGPLTAKLPPLDSLDSMEHRLLLAGFPALTLGIVSGAVFVADIDSTQLARAVLSTTAWLVLAGVLILRAVAGWRGRRAAYGTIAGTVCILLVVLVYVVRPVAGGGL